MTFQRERNKKCIDHIGVRHRVWHTDRREPSMKKKILLIVLLAISLSGCGFLEREEDSVVQYNSKFYYTPDEKLKDAIDLGYHELLNEAIADGANIHEFPGRIAENNRERKKEQNPLAWGVDVGTDIYILEKLLQAGADVNSYDKKGRPVIFEAATQRDFMLIELLVENGADLTKESKSGRSLLEYYFKKGSVMTDAASRREVSYFLDHGAVVNKKVVRTAIRTDNYHIMRELVQSQPKYGNMFSKMQKAFLQGNITQGNRLLEKKVKVDRTDIFLAISYGDKDTYRVLNEEKHIFDDSKIEPWKLLRAAVAADNLEMVKCIAGGREKLEPSRDYPDRELWPVICQNDNVEMLKYMYKQIHYFELGNDFCKRLPDYDAENIVHYLVESDPNMQLNSEEAYEMFKLALYRGNTEMVRYLLQEGFDPNRKDPNSIWDSNLDSNEFILKNAIQGSNPELFRLMIQKGGDLEQFGSELIKDSIIHSNLEAIQILLEYGVEIPVEECNEEIECCSSDHIRELLSAEY